MSSASSPDSLHPVSPSQSSPPPVDLRHMTSNTGLASPVKDSSKEHRVTSRSPQHLQTSTARLGSRSPNSIPSSPTSVHSSSSAIFERDIEPISSPSPPNSIHHPPNPHRIPRSKTTEQLEQSVPSVLDTAASILASLNDEGDQIAVVAPASTTIGRTSGFASPIGSFRSRSPSPLGTRPGGGASLLLSIPYPNQQHPQPASGIPPSVHVSTPHVPTSIPQIGSPHSQTMNSPLSGGLTARPVIHTSVPPGTTHATISGTPQDSPSPAMVTPTSAYFSTSSSIESSPTTTTREHPPHSFPPVSSPSAISPSAHSHSHPPSPTNAATKRLSFMSYSDLLTSTPASTLPLSSLTTSASMVEPPPHIPSVSGLTQAQAQQAGSAAASVRNFGGGRDRDSIAMFDDVGGEWEREGLGMGLEERLDALLPVARA